MDNEIVPSDVTELAELLLAEWPRIRERIRHSGHPTCEGDDDGEGEGDTEGDPAGDGEGEADGDKNDGDDGEGEGDKPGKPAGEQEWKKLSRRHERESKAAKRRADELEKQLRSYQDRDKTDHEKAVEEALAKGREEASGQYETERRRDRLELAVTRIAAAKGVKVGQGEDAKVVKFADAEIVQVWIERQLADGTLSADELFDDKGKVNQGALTDALVDLADDKPYLLTRADTNGDRGASSGRPVDFEGGRGKSGGQKDLEEMSPEDHYQALRGKS